MTNTGRLLAATWFLACGFVASAQDASLGPMPRVLDDRLKLELFAEHPQLVTPTGIDVDHLGRVWVLESNTHFPPEGYQGHPTDRLLVLQDKNGDGRADEPTVFADGFKFAMSVAVLPVWMDVVEGRRSRVEGKNKDAPTPSTPSTLDLQPSTVFVATRGEIVRLRDTNDDLKADERTQLVHLETAGNYPHNGLAGLAFDALGWMYFGFGENLGADYKIIGSDGVTLSGGGEGGNVYRCRPDGSKLQRWATGFWNPHASCIDAFGRLFTVDNDPDSRPPCRLLHVVEGGDYGYRFRNGRRGTHPFTAWNGEIPGTLPMVSGTGEAPSGIVAYESDGFPADYLGTLLVGTWGDHRIDQFVLEPKGASFVSKPKPIVQGNENFRPVGLAVAPDGSLFFSDWVLRDYKLHRKGRVWRLSAKEKTIQGGSLPQRRLAARVLSTQADGWDKLRTTLRDTDLPVRNRVEAFWALANLPSDQQRHFWGESKAPERFCSEMNELGVVALEWMHTSSERIDFGAFTETIFAKNPWGQPGLGSHWYAALLRQWNDPIKGSLAGVPLVLAFEQKDAPFLHQAASFQFPRFFPPGNVPDIIRAPRSASVPDQSLFLTWVLYDLRQRVPQNRSIPQAALESPAETVQFAAVQWIGEEKLNDLRPNVEAVLQRASTSPRLLMACLATLSLLDGVPAAEFEKTPPTAQMLKIVNDDQRPAALRAIALRTIPAATPELSLDRLLAFTKSDDAALKTEAVRTLQQAPRPAAIPALLAIAADENVDVSLRADALAGLCATPHDEPLPADVEALLLNAAQQRLRLRDPSHGALLQLEAIRALRGRAVPGTKIGDLLKKIREDASEKSALREALDIAINGKSSVSVPQLSTLDHQPSPDSGRRVFYHHQGPLCFKCHTVNGRGGNVGPDLSVIARTMDRAKLLSSILAPSKEISPQYLTWTIATVDGKTFTGIVVTETGGGDLDLGDNQGKVIKIPRKEIEERVPSNVSVMPQGLHQQMTPQELADLLSYLETLK